MSAATADIHCRVEHRTESGLRPLVWHWSVCHGLTVTAGACEQREQAWAAVEAVLRGELRLRKPGRGRLAPYL